MSDAFYGGTHQRGNYLGQDRPANEVRAQKKKPANAGSLRPRSPDFGKGGKQTLVCLEITLDEVRPKLRFGHYCRALT